MQSDYVSAFGIGGLISSSPHHHHNNNNNNNSNNNNSHHHHYNQRNHHHSNKLLRDIVDQNVIEEYDKTSPPPPVSRVRVAGGGNQQPAMYSKSSTIISTSPPPPPLPQQQLTSPNNSGGSPNKQRNRFNSVETPPNTSSSSTDTVTPLHAVSVAAMAATAAAAKAAAAAVLRRSQSIKAQAQAKRKSAMRSLSHTLPSSSAATAFYHPHPSNGEDADNYDLENLKIKYESFCDRDIDDGDGDVDVDININQDADIEDEEDEADENKSLLVLSQQQQQQQQLQLQHQHSSQSQSVLHTKDLKDVNNNTSMVNVPLLSGANQGGSVGNNGANVGGGDDLKVIIVNSNEVVATKKPISKRSDSIRMRHHSNVSNAGMMINHADDAASSTSSSSRLKKYFKCRNKKIRSKASQRRHNYIAIFLLFVVNLLNYIDRYTLAGVLLDVQNYFDISDGESGLLQTVFICSYMLLAPLFGYMGDRYSRKWLIIFGITFWSFMTFIGSFVPKDQFWLFVIIRSLVGIGEASYSCVAPTIIGDLFTGTTRTKMLAVFYLAVPVGSGLGYIVGSNVAQLTNDWRWALRVTPGFGFASVIFLALLVQEPKRGSAESGNGGGSLTGSSGDSNDMGASRSNIKEDVIYLLKKIPLKFGVVTCISGLLGVALSSVIAEKLRKRMPNADPLVCALGSLIAVPTLFVLILSAGAVNEILFWLITAVAISAMCLSWTIVADILLYAIYPHRRSIASALNILICHLFGDAGSPYVIGAISDLYRRGKPDTYFTKFSSLQVALYAGPFFAALSFAAYLFTAIYVVDDKKDVDDYLRRCKQMSDAINGSGEDANEKNLTSSNESTLNEMSPSPATSSRALSKKHRQQQQQLQSPSSAASHNLSNNTVEQNAYLNPVAFAQDIGTANELDSNSTK